MGKAKKVGSAFLHVGGGVAIAAAILWNAWLAGPALLVVGLLRERAQHRYKLTLVPAAFHQIPQKRNLYEAEKRSFSDFGWLTWHTFLEALWWGVGGLLVSGGCEFIRWKILE